MNFNRGTDIYQALVNRKSLWLKKKKDSGIEILYVRDKATFSLSEKGEQ